MIIIQLKYSNTETEAAHRCSGINNWAFLRCYLIRVSKDCIEDCVYEFHEIDKMLRAMQVHLEKSLEEIPVGSSLRLENLEE